MDSCSPHSAWTRDRMPEKSKEATVASSGLHHSSLEACPRHWINGRLRRQNEVCFVRSTLGDLTVVIGKKVDRGIIPIFGFCVISFHPSSIGVAILVRKSLLILVVLISSTNVPYRGKGVGTPYTAPKSIPRKTGAMTDGCCRVGMFFF